MPVSVVRQGTDHNHDDRYLTEGETLTDLTAKADTAHTHVGADVTGGTIAYQRLGAGIATEDTALFGDGWRVPDVPDHTHVLSDLDAPTASVSMGNQLLTSLATPVAGTDAATKAYADSVASGLDLKASVRVATTANITLSGTQTIDGIAVIANDRVLVKNQSTGANNGIYLCAAGAWSRATDADTSAEVTTGMFVFVESGTAHGGQGWVLTTPPTITLGSTALTFTQFSDNGGSSGGGVDYIASADPGTVGAQKLWIDDDDGTFWKRNAANTKWQPIAQQPKGVLDAGYFGAVGDGTTDDTAAFQTMLAYADSLGTLGWTVYIPAGSSGDYKLTSALTWPNNVNSWIGSKAGRPTSDVRLSWFGAAGATMISLETTGASQHGKMFRNIAMRSGDDANKAAIAIEYTDRLDSFSLIEECSFSDFTGNPLRFLGGAINLHIRRYRCDGNGDHGVYFVVAGTCNCSFHQWTIDNDPSSGFTGGAGGAIEFDASAAANNSLLIASIDDANFEVQKDIANQSTNGMVLLTNKPDTSGRIIYNVSLGSVIMSGARAGLANGNKSLRVTPDSDDVILRVRNSLLPGSIAGIPNLVLTDSALGSSGWVSDLIVNPFSVYIGDFPSGTKGPASVIVGEVNFLQGPLKSHGVEITRRYKVLPASLPSGTPVYVNDEFTDSTVTSASLALRRTQVCTVRGIAGTLSSVTGTGTSGQSTITLNDVTSLRKGQFLTVAGSSKTEYQIRHINATTRVVTLHTTLDLSPSSAAIGWVAPQYATQVEAFNSIANTADSTAVNTTASETNFSQTLSYPANSLVAGKAYRITARGVYGTTSAGTLTMRLRLKTQSQTLADTGAVTLGASQTNRGWELDCTVICRTVGASGTLSTQGKATWFSGTLPATTATSTDMENTGTATVDTTAAVSIIVSVQHGASNAANTATLTHLIVEPIA